MSEQLSSDQPENAAEFSRQRALNEVIEQYFSEDDREFLAGFDEQDKISAVYGQLLEIGEDPDTVLIESGVLENEDEV